MKYRLATILAREEHSSDITKVIDLNLADPVSQLIVIYQPYNTTETLSAGHPIACVTKIELVDGSDVLYSLSGFECQAVDWYHRLKEPYHVIDYRNTKTSTMICNLNFGRFLYDSVLALDPKRFTNPQLKITLDIDAGGVTTTKGYLSVFAHIFDEKTITPIGFLMHKQIKDYPLGDGTHEYTDLPADFPIRKLLLRGYLNGTDVEDVFGNVKISEDNDKRIPVDHSIDEVLWSIISQNIPYKETMITHGHPDGRKYHNTTCQETLGSADPWSGGSAAQTAWAGTLNGGYVEVHCENAGINVMTYLQGWCPHGVIEIPFGLQVDLDDWYDVVGLGSLILDITSGSGMSSSESIQVFLQQLRKYA